MSQLDTFETLMPPPEIRERAALNVTGLPVFGVAVALGVAGFALSLLGTIDLAEGDGGVALVVAGSVLLVAGSIVGVGLIMVAPGEARVIQFLGRYVGTVRSDGLRWINPFTLRRKISTRIRNHETAVTKVNDADGSPIEIAAVVVWRVTDTARAIFEVDDYIEFVNIQTETAVRHIATT
jgi:regulator of protease activity HflC (stomatin/prohibitin superfamily)